MLGRLFNAIHWVLLIVFVAMWCLFLFVIITDNDIDRTVRNIFKMLDGDHGLWGILFSGAMTWIPIVFVLIDYVVNGKLIWLPWQRNKD